MSGVEDKSRLLGRVKTLKQELGELQRDLLTSVPNAKGLLVCREMEKTDKALERVHTGLMELVL